MPREAREGARGKAAFRMNLVCIVPAAGRGARLGSKKDKPFVKIGGIPLLARTLSALERSNLVDGIALSVRGGNVKKATALVRKYGFGKVIFIVRGGRRRFDSVRNALREVGDSDFVMVHDAARPFVSEKVIRRVFNAAKTCGAAICAIPVTDTLKKTKKGIFVARTEDRRRFWKAQTPQVFRKDIILKAYSSRREKNATDDSKLVEKMGRRVKMVKGSPRNIKITTREDLELAKALLKNKA